MPCARPRVWFFDIRLKINIIAARPTLYQDQDKAPVQFAIDKFGALDFMVCNAGAANALRLGPAADFAGFMRCSPRTGSASWRMKHAAAQRVKARRRDPSRAWPRPRRSSPRRIGFPTPRPRARARAGRRAPPHSVFFSLKSFVSICGVALFVSRSTFGAQTGSWDWPIGWFGRGAPFAHLRLAAEATLHWSRTCLTSKTKWPS